MTQREIISDLSTDAQQREHIRKQEKLDYNHKLFMRCCNWLLMLFIVVMILSIIVLGAYIFKCPYVSEKGFDLLVETWKYIGSYIFGALSVKYGLKNSNE